MIDSLVVGNVVLEKEVPDAIDNENNLIYDIKTMTNSRLKDRKDMVDAISTGTLWQHQTYFGIDFGKGHDETGRVMYWVAPYKYKTAGFNHHMTWKYIYGWWGLDLKNLPINYNFDMAKLYFGNFIDEELTRNKRIVRLMLNSRYGMLGANAKSMYDFYKKYNVLYAPRSAYKMNFDKWFEYFYDNVIKLRRRK